MGLKENVIIGKLIPAGTGLMKYRGLKINTEEDAQADIKIEKKLEAEAEAETE